MNDLNLPALAAKDGVMGCGLGAGAVLLSHAAAMAVTVNTMRRSAFVIAPRSTGFVVVRTNCFGARRVPEQFTQRDDSRGDVVS